MKSEQLLQPNTASVTQSRIHLQTTGLGKRYNREWIFGDFSHRFDAGNTYAITGPNGSGKSTLLQVLWGQLPQSTGNLDYAINSVTVSVEEIFKHVSIAAPYLDLIDEFTLDEIVKLHFKLRKLREGIQPEEVVSRMQLEHAKQKQLQYFSSGMKQRVKLGLALYTEAAFVFLDEPFTNLDESAIAWYKNQLTLLKNSIVFIASNNREEYEEATSCFKINDYKQTG